MVWSISKAFSHSPSLDSRATAASFSAAAGSTLETAGNGAAAPAAADVEAPSPGGGGVAAAFVAALLPPLLLTLPLPLPPRNGREPVLIPVKDEAPEW